MSLPNPYESPATPQPTWGPSPFVPAVGPPAIFRPLGKWATISCVGLIINAMGAVIFVLCSAALMVMYLSVSSADEIDPTFEAFVMATINIVAIAVLAARLLTGIPFLTWMYKAHANLPALGARKLTQKPIMAVLGWFIPIANLVWPYLMMKEIWEQSHEPPGRVMVTTRSGIVLAWWLTWIGMGVSAIVGNIADASVQSLESFAFATGCDVVHGGAMTIAACLAFFIVRRVTREQTQRHEAMESAPPAMFGMPPA